MNDESQNAGTGVNPSTPQGKLLTILAVQHYLSNKTGFRLVRSPNHSEIQGSSGIPVPCNYRDEDFYELQGAQMITLAWDSKGQLCGQVTERGIDHLFGAQKEHVVDTLQKVAEANDWEKEHRSFFHAGILENVPPEAASPQEFIEYTLNAVSRLFDIQVRGFVRCFSSVTQIKDMDYERLLGKVEEGLFTQATKIRQGFLSTKTWPADVKRVLGARKQRWIGLRLRAIRKERERQQSESINSANDDPVSLDPIVHRRQCMLSEYKVATGNPSNRSIYTAKNSSIHKPEFYDWLSGKLAAESQTTINFERFLTEKKVPVPRVPTT